MITLLVCKANCHYETIIFFKQEEENLSAADLPQGILLSIRLEILNIFPCLENQTQDMHFHYSLVPHLHHFRERGEDLDQAPFKVQEHSLDNIQV